MMHIGLVFLKNPWPHYQLFQNVILTIHSHSQSLLLLVDIATFELYSPLEPPSGIESGSSMGPWRRMRDTCMEVLRQRDRPVR